MSSETTQPSSAIVLETSAIESISKAEVDMQIATAKKFPRNIAAVKNKIEQLATLDEETAEQCFYRLERDGKVIEGPSVRLAEIAMMCYSNIRAGYRPMSNDGKKVTAQGICYDLENNVSISIEKSRRITKRDGSTYSEDMQINTANAIGAIVFRDAVFKVVPQVLVKPAMEKAKQVALGKAESLTSRRDSIITRLRQFCPNTERILAAVKRTKADELDQADILTLMGLATALKDGEITVEEAFPVVAAAPKRLFKDKAEAKAPEQPADAIAQAPAPADTPAETPAPAQDQDRLDTIKSIRANRRYWVKAFTEIALAHGIDTVGDANWEKADTDTLKLIDAELKAYIADRQNGVGR